MPGNARLVLFGTAALLDGEGRDVPLPRMGFVLALHLILGCRGLEASRAEAASFLWPNSRSALVNLRQLLSRLRAAQGDIALFRTRGDRIALGLDGVDCDLLAFRDLLGRVDMASAGPLMDLVAGGLFASGAAAVVDEPGAWLRGEAERINAAAIAAVADVLDGPGALADPARALALSTRLLDLDPYAEPGWRGLIRFHCATGHFARAAEALARYRRTLEDELGLAPSKAVETLFLKLSAARSPPPALVPASAALDPAPGELPPPATARPRLVILPPDGSSPGAGDLAWLARLLVEDVTIGLCAARSVDVVAPHTAWNLTEELLDEETVERFRIGYVLKTRLCTFDGRTTLGAQLHETSGRSILWADRIPLSQATSEECYRRISVAAISAVAEAIDRGERRRYEGRESSVAYYWHLVGQHHLRQFDLPKIRRARKFFAKAIKADPGFAPAHSGHARSLQREWLLLGRDDRHLLAAALASGQEATGFDPADARGFRELGISHLYLRRFDESLAAYEEAERLSPRHADIIADHADALAHSGKPEEGLEKMRRAFELNPIPPEDYWWNLGGIQFQLGRYHEAIETIRRIETPPARLRLLAAAFAMLGQHEVARGYAAQFLETYPDFRIDRWLSLVPNRNLEDTLHYERGLRSAGFL